MRDQLIGHLVVGMVIVFKPDPKYTDAPTVGIIRCIADGVTPKPQFTVDVVLGSCDTPAFIHNYKVLQFVNKIQRVCYVMLLQ